ncbi:MAG TPA: hypothetical protein VFF73_04195 [Planctomycetota bacterium]|nr:hypothetical protein [Planctomycetota bacterium]
MSLPTNRDEIMRKIGVGQKLFSRDQWKQAVELRGRMGGGSVGDALVKMGAISPDQLRSLFRAVDYRVGRNEDKELARVILDSGYAEEPSVEAALKQQKEIYGASGKLARLCDLLMERALLSESQHIAARKILEIARATRNADSAAPDEASD